MSPRLHHLALCGALATFSCGLGTAAAEQLNKEACDALRGEEAILTTAGIKTDMEKGPEWAKANLAPERLQQAARYIELEEQLSFRCRVLAAPVRKKGAPGKGAAKAAAVHVAPDDPEAHKDTGQEAKTSAGTPQTGAGKPVATPTVPRLRPAAKPATRRQSPATAKVRRPAPHKTGLFSVE